MQQSVLWSPHESSVICELFRGKDRQKCVEVEWKHAYEDGSLDVCFETETVRVKMMLVNTAGEGEIANCKFSSSAGVPCIRSLVLKRNKVHVAGSYLNVWYYATSGQMSTKFIKASISFDEAVLKAHRRVIDVVRGNPKTKFSNVCKRCFILVVSNRKKAKLHQLTCPRTALNWSLKELHEFDATEWVATNFI